MKLPNWKKKGFIFTAEENSHWMNSHVQNPCPVVLEDRIRVFFNTRPKSIDGTTTSHPVFIDLEIDDPSKILNICREPILTLGEIGGFDQFGCMTSSVIQRGEELLMYYVGWQRGVSTPYNWAIGLAKSSDKGETFKKQFRGPVIGAHLNEPYLQNGCYAFKDGNNLLHMWYSTGIEWYELDGKMESRYVIVHAHSTDGINWIRDGQPIIPFNFDDETQTTPSVFKYAGVYHMVFSSRHSKDFRNKERGYKLGYAWSKDLITWNRDDLKLDLSVSDSGWDSEMVCYPQVIKNGSKLQMFYCGNYFGKGGLGYAEAELNA